MRMKLVSLFFVLALGAGLARAQGTVPTFQQKIGEAAYTLLGRNPAAGGVTTIPTLLVPITLTFDSKKVGGKPFVMDPRADVPRLLRSPVFAKFAFPAGGNTQYADALLRASFPQAEKWHTLLGKPQVRPLKISVPAGLGYVLTSKKTGQSMGVLDLEFLEKELFKQIPKQEGTLVIALTHNTTFFADGDATVCCTWGSHGVDSATGNSFLLSSYLDGAPAIVEDGDVQPLTQQLAEFANDPLHDSLLGNQNQKGPGNTFPRWMRPASMRPGDQGVCGGTGVGSAYFFLEPTDTNLKNNFPASPAFVAQVKGTAYHLENVALLPWYTGAAEGLGSTYSFPDAQALAEPAQPCPARGRRPAQRAALHLLSPPWRRSLRAARPTATSSSATAAGYGFGAARLKDISPQWDVIIVAFSTPEKNAPEGTLQFHTPSGLDPAQFKADIADLKSQGKKVLISLGGGGVYVPLDTPDAHCELRLLHHAASSRTTASTASTSISKARLSTLPPETRTSSIPPRPPS